MVLISIGVDINEVMVVKKNWIYVGAAVCRNIYIGVESTLLKSQVMVVEKNSVDSFSPGVEIAVVRDMEGGLLLVCSASGKYDKTIFMILKTVMTMIMMAVSS